MNPFQLDRGRIRRLAEQREAEWRQMQDYVDCPTCLMAFLTTTLDDPGSAPCGRCAVCLGRDIVGAKVGSRSLAAAVAYDRLGEVRLKPRERWETGALPAYGWSGVISVDLRNQEGRALGVWGESGWARLVEQGKNAGYLPDALVDACVALLRERWRPHPSPTWITCIPSRRTGQMLPDLARRLAAKSGVPFRRPC